MTASVSISDIELSPVFQSNFLWVRFVVALISFEEVENAVQQ